MTEIKNKKGYVTIFAVVILTGIALGLVLAGSFSSYNQIVNSGEYVDIYQTNQSVDACAEEILQLIRDNSAFAGSGTFIFDGDDCDYAVSGDSSTKTIQLTMNVNGFVRKTLINVSAISPLIVVSKWAAVSDF